MAFDYDTDVSRSRKEQDFVLIALYQLLTSLYKQYRAAGLEDLAEEIALDIQEAETSLLLKLKEKHEPNKNL